MSALEIETNFNYVNIVIFVNNPVTNIRIHKRRKYTGEEHQTENSEQWSRDILKYRLGI